MLPKSLEEAVLQPNRTLPDGMIDHPHALIQFFDGAPSYFAVRERILASLPSPRPVRLGRAGL